MNFANYLLKRGLQHPNVVRMFGIYIDEAKNNYMVMELVPKGSLKALLNREKSKITLIEKYDM